ncbi:MAG TPA: transposase [Bryobacteraceae bacterium]|nr:transposase [Bryobacteraceae bacterium]
MFRWFVGLEMNEEVWHATTFSKSQNRLLAGDLPREGFATVVRQAKRRGLTSSVHFSVCGTKVEV